jgi:hypothetical protein
LIRQLASATTFQRAFDFNCFEDSHYYLIIRAISICERPWGRAPELPRSLLPRRIKAQSSRFQKTCLSNGGRKVVGGQWPESFNAFQKKLQA